MADLPTNLKDDILNSSVNTRRKYRMIENGDGTYSFEDVTEYNQVGDEYGAGLINETNRQVNARVEKAVVVRDLETIGAITQPGFIPDALALKDVNGSLTADNAQAFQFAYDSESGKYGYKVKEADTDVFVPFSGVNGLELVFSERNASNSTLTQRTYTSDGTYQNFIAISGVGKETFTIDCTDGTMLYLSDDFYTIENTNYKVKLALVTLNNGGTITTTSRSLHVWGVN